MATLLIEHTGNGKVSRDRYAQKFYKRLDLPDSILLDESQSLNLWPDRRDIFCKDAVGSPQFSPGASHPPPQPTGGVIYSAKLLPLSG
jgi:hypothetical protein